MLLYIPVLAKLWKQHELWDGTYIITDLLDIHEAMTIKNQNEKLFYENEMRKVELQRELNNYGNSFGRLK